MVRQLIDSRLRTNIPDHWPSLCTIQDVVYGESASKQKIAVTYNDVTGQTDIPCRLAGPVRAVIGIDEKKTEKDFTVHGEMIIMLNAYLPNIQIRTQVAVVDGILYQVRGVDTDSQKFQTRLRVEVLT